MKLRTTAHGAILAGLLSGLLGQACGQKPSFTEDESRARNGEGQGVQNSGDQTGVPPGHVDGPDTLGDHEPKEPEGTGEGEDAVSDGQDVGDDAADGDGQDSSDVGGDDGVDIPEVKKVTSEQEFPAQTFGDANATKDLDSAYLTSEITMVRNYTNKNVQKKQITRQTLIDSFDQGNAGAAETQTFDQVAGRPLDLLVVVDNSQSMTEEQQNLSNKLAPLLQYVQDTDWQIGVVTTDPDQTCLRKLIKKGDANAATAFAQGVTAGVAGSNNERGLLQAYRSISGVCPSGGPAAPWVRAESTLAVLIVSDEDNCSDGLDCPGKPYATANFLTDYLASIRELGKNARVYGLIWHPSQDKTMCPTAANKANIYAQVIDATMGTWGSICDADYSATLSQVSQNIMTSLNSKFTLRYVPDAGTVRVFLDANEITTGFTVTGKVVDINPPPADGVKVTISYKYGAQPIKTRFVLRSTPIPARTSVTVNGMTVPATDYTVNAAVPSIDFAVPPADRAKVVVTYVKEQALSTQFSVGDNIKPGTLSVKVNGVATTDYTVAEPVGSITFNVAPPESATIDFAYTAVGSAVLSYPFTASYGAPKDLVAYDATTMTALNFLYLFGNVTFFQGDYVEGRKVTLRYDNVPRQRFEVELASDPVPGYTVATGGSVTCNKAPQLQVAGRIVKVDGCGFEDDVTTVRVDYKYVLQAFQEFTFTAGKLPAPGDFQEWHVFVNGAETANFVRDGFKFSFTNALPLGSKVKIQLIQEDK